MKKVSFAICAAALVSLGALTAPAHAQYGHQGQRYPHNVIVVPGPPPPPPGYYGHQPQRWHHGDRRDYRGDHYRGGRGYGDRDGDGIPNRYDRDRDNDGVPNRYDQRPNNPYRY